MEALEESKPPDSHNIVQFTVPNFYHSGIFIDLNRKYRKYGMRYLWNITFQTHLVSASLHAMELFQAGVPFTNMDEHWIPAWINNAIHYKVLNEIIYPFPGMDK